MDRNSRRQILREFKEKTPAAGVYVIRCVQTGQSWVGASPNIDAVWNRMAFSLRTGADRNAAMQAAWKAHGEAGVVFEVLERIDDPDLTPLGRADLIKSRERHWRAALGASRATG